MILLDTNVVSAIMQPKPDPAVLEWLRHQVPTSLYLSSVTIAEILFGLRILPEGQRRQRLEDQFARFLARGFEQRILPFDEPAARMYAELMGRRRQRGRPMSLPDGQIAAIARTHHCAIATRNLRDFDECGLEVVNPFA